MSRKVRFMLALVVLTLWLGSGAAHALPSEGRNADRDAGMLAAVWEWLTSLVAVEVPFLPVHEAIGEEIPAPPSTPDGDPGDGGVFIDPNG